MACALLSDHLKMYLKAGETRLSVLMGGHSDDSRAMSRSALQNPELSRYELDCLLRRTGGQPRATGWASFFAGATGSCANSNAAGAEIS
jgi:hypothetical protein